MNDFNSFFNLLILGCGLYCLYQSVQLIRTGTLPSNSILLSKERPLSQCLDPEGFIAYMKPRFLIFSVLMVLSSLVSILNDFLGFLDRWTAPMTPALRLVVLEVVSFLIPFGVLVWFAVCLVKTQKQLW